MLVFPDQPTESPDTEFAFLYDQRPRILLSQYRTPHQYLLSADVMVLCTRYKKKPKHCSERFRSCLPFLFFFFSTPVNYVLFRTTHKVKTQHGVKSRGQHCGDIQLEVYLANESGPVPLVLDLRIAHDRVGSRTDHNLNGHLKYPNNFDQSLNDTAADKVRKYRPDYNNRSPSVVSFMTAIASTSGRLHSEFVRLLFLQAHRETDRLFAASGVLSAQSDRGFYHLRRAAVSAQLKSKVGLVLAKAAALRITLNLDGSPIISRTHTHPSHSQTSRLLTSSLSLGVPVPRGTQCMRGA